MVDGKENIALHSFHFFIRENFESYDLYKAIVYDLVCFKELSQQM